jgi:hypothetical protein
MTMTEKLDGELAHSRPMMFRGTFVYSDCGGLAGFYLSNFGVACAGLKTTKELTKRENYGSSERKYQNNQRGGSAVKIKLKKEVLLEMGLPYECALEDEVVSSSRWRNTKQIVFAFEGKHYSALYESGKTEMQDESPWEFESEVECTEVHQVPVTKMEWHPVES